MQHKLPVVIVGGGPVGLSMAILLQRVGIKFVLLERNATTTGEPFTLTIDLPIRIHLNATPETRDDLVAKLRQQVSSGTYKVSGADIADQMVRRAQADRIR